MNPNDNSQAATKGLPLNRIESLAEHSLSKGSFIPRIPFERGRANSPSGPYSSTLEPGISLKASSIESPTQGKRSPQTHTSKLEAWS